MMQASSIARAVGLLDAWLDGMRGSSGYGGPVVHWWRDSIVFCGAGLDWRYEGVIAGYVSLFERTGRRRYLDRARRAGDDLVAGQLPDGRFANSSFEANPAAGGTPHEAAADIGLLLIARTLRAAAEPGWDVYLAAARKSLQRVHVARLWQPQRRRFGDGGTWFVPNKAATIVEALCLLAELTASEHDLEHYVRPTADAIVAHQVVQPGHRLDGAIAQASRDDEPVERYFPFYVARTIPGLCAAYRVLGDERHLEAAIRAAAFIVRCREDDGGIPQVLYRNGRTNRFPRWVAGAGDVVRGLTAVAEHGATVDVGPTLRWLLDGQLPTGAFRVAEGFASLASQRAKREPADVRDVMPVVGWNDKAFRALAALAEDVTDETPASTELPGTWHGRPVAYREDASRVTVSVGTEVVYGWEKRRAWAALGQGGRSHAR